MIANLLVGVVEVLTVSGNFFEERMVLHQLHLSSLELSAELFLHGGELTIAIARGRGRCRWNLLDRPYADIRSFEIHIRIMLAQRQILPCPQNYQKCKERANKTCRKGSK